MGKRMNKAKLILGKFLRLLAVVALIVLTFINLLTILFSSFARTFYQVPEIVVISNKIINGFFIAVFVYGIYLLIKNNRKYLRLFGCFLPAYYLYLTIYRFFFITHGQLEGTDIGNLLVYMAPLFMMFVGYKMEPQATKSVVSSAPETGPFSPLQYQGFIVRGLANIIDQILVSLPLITIASLTDAGSNGNQETYIAIGGLLFLVYLTLAEAIWGQTLGKRLFGIKVMMQDGRKCTWVGAILRNVLRIIDMVLGGYILGIAAITLTSRRQRFGDLIAKTVVIKP